MKTSTKAGLVAVSLVIISSVLVTAVNASTIKSMAEGNECLGWYNSNRADFLVREGVLPGTFVTCDQGELDKLNELLKINEHEGEKFTVPPELIAAWEDKGQDDNNERLDKKYCAGSGFWDGHRCVIDDPVEKAAYEDAVCDDPKDTDKYSKICGGSYAVEEKPKQKDKVDNNSRQQHEDDNQKDKKEKVEDNKIFAAASEKYKELVKDIDDDNDDDKQKDSHDENDNGKDDGEDKKDKGSDDDGDKNKDKEDSNNDSDKSNNESDK